MRYNEIMREMDATLFQICKIFTMIIKLGDFGIQIPVCPIYLFDRASYGQSKQTFAIIVSLRSLGRYRIT